MPRPKRLKLLTGAPAHTAEAIEEWKDGVDAFLEWANRARTGETSLPEAIQVDAALTAFSEGRFHISYINLSAGGRNRRQDHPQPRPRQPLASADVLRM